MTEFTREEMMRCIFEKYDEYTQENRSQVSYGVAFRPLGHVHADTPLAITPDSDTDYVCAYILDCALECEINFKDTFWLEVMRVLQYEACELLDEVHKTKEELFEHFLHFMLEFNETYTKTLPPIFHDMDNLRHVVALYRHRKCCETLLLYKMETMKMYVKVLNPEEDPLLEENVPEREIPYSYEDLFDRMNIGD